MRQVLDNLAENRPLTRWTTREALELVGLNETMLLKISKVRDGNERLNFIRSLTQMVTDLSEEQMRVCSEIASGQARLVVVAAQPPFAVVDLMVGPSVRESTDTTDQTRTH
jgi:hypothetical protein